MPADSARPVPRAPGRGPGPGVHEEATPFDGRDFVLEGVMVAMIENDRYVLGGAGYLVEDLAHVTGAGPMVMTDVPRDPVLTR